MNRSKKEMYFTMFVEKLIDLLSYLDKIGLELNAGKTKVLRFREGGRRMSRMSWWWKRKKIEEVKEYKYLGYIFQRNGGKEIHIWERQQKQRQ